MVLLRWVTQRQVMQNRILISAADFGDTEIPGPLKVRNYAVSGPLGDSYLHGDIANTNLWLCGNSQKDMGMIGQEGPCRIWHCCHVLIVAHFLSFDT
jgi:hypothetical protein